jgi:hypothetical protein
MPPKKQQKKAKKKPKQNKQRKGRGATLTGSGGKVLKSLIAPPTNYAGTYRASPFMSFSAGSKPGGLKMHFRQRVAIVSLNYATVTGAPSVSLIIGGTQIQGTYFVCPANLFYTPAPLSTFANLFTSWRSDGVCFEFVPRAAGGSSNGISMTIGWSEDPMYPDTHGWTNTSGGWLPTETQVSVLEQAVQFPVWIPQQCIKSPPKKEWLYSVGADFNSRVDPSDFVADVRMQYSGLLAVSGSENTPGTPGTSVILGSLYMEGSCEFHELASPITVDPSTSLPVKKCERKERERKER